MYKLKHAFVIRARLVPLNKHLMPNLRPIKEKGNIYSIERSFYLEHKFLIYNLEKSRSFKYSLFEPKCILNGICVHI